MMETETKILDHVFVVYENHGRHIDFRFYKIIQKYEDGCVYLDLHTPVSEYENVDFDAKGDINWQGCMHLDTCGNVHFCDNECIDNLASMIKEVRAFLVPLMEKWSDK